MNIVLGIVVSIVVSYSTFSFIKRPKITPTRASSIISLIGVSILYGVSSLISVDFESWSLLIFGASFVGMCSHKKFKDIEVLLSAVLFGIIYVFLLPLLTGLGGALGFCAFVSILLVAALSFCFQQSSKRI